MSFCNKIRRTIRISQSKHPRIQEPKSILSSRVNQQAYIEAKTSRKIINNKILCVYAICTHDDSLGRLQKSSEELRSLGIKVLCETLRRSMRAQMREANKCGADFAIIIGEEEFINETIQVKNLIKGTQESIKYQNLITYFKSLTF